MRGFMMIGYETLLVLYPIDVRESYGDEMVSAYNNGLVESRRRGPAAVIRFVAGQMIWLFCEAVAERVSTLYSHRSFHGRCRPNMSLVRPPNMGGREWFYGGESST
jgi:hypothetical protein